MEGVGESLPLLGVLSFLLALLIYAMRTLAGMREKLLYPLLRLKRPDGSVSPMVRVKADRRSGMHTYVASAI